jgi:5-methylcytosine-specific restriction enzyme A
VIKHSSASTRPWCRLRLPQCCTGLAHHLGPDGPVCDACYQRQQRQAQPPARRPGGSRGAPPHIRRRVLARDSHQCQLRYAGCSGTATEVDHIKNVASYRIDGRAGANHPANAMTNLVSACSYCHKQKTEQERIAALRASAQTRAAQRRKRLHLPEHKHPGDW